MISSDKVDWVNKPEKGVARDFAVGYELTNYNIYFCLPSYSCKDLKEGLKKGTIRHSDFIIAADNNSKNYDAIESYLKRNFARYHFHKGDVQDIDLRAILDGYKVGSKIDFTFLDLCGNFGKEIFSFLYTQRECFAETCRFGLTIAAPNRHKPAGLRHSLPPQTVQSLVDRKPFFRSYN